MKVFKKFILFVSFVCAMSGYTYSQTIITNTVTWTTGWCNICGPTTGNYACNPPWSGSGTWNNGMRTFNVPAVAGMVVTSVCVTVNKVNCGYTNLCVNINGQLIGCSPPSPPGNCSCGTCWPENFCASFPCPTGLPNFNYGGTNTVQLVNTGDICVNNAIITLTYTTCCPIPTITANASPTAICIGQSSTLTASGAGIGGTYSWTPGGLTGSAVVVSPTVTTTYTVFGTTTYPCTGSRTIQLVVNPLPTITAVANPTSVCVGQTSSTLTFGGGVNYTLQPGNFFGGTAVVSPSVPTVYTVTGANANGCVNTATVQVGINPVTVPVANSPSACAGSPLNFAASGGVAYQWSGPGGFTSLAQNPVIAAAQASNAGQYTVVVTSAFGCTASTVSNAVVVVVPPPVISHNAIGGICYGNTLTLSGNGGNSYNWVGPNGFVSALQSPTIGPVNLFASGIYSLVITLNTCTSMATASITVNPLPVPILLSNSPVCLFEQITFTATGGVSYTIAGPGGYLSNNPLAVIPVANNITSGVYTLTTMDNNSCVNSNTSTVLINQLPIISAVGSTVCANKTVNLSVSGGTAYVWSGPAGFASTAPNPAIPNADLSMIGNYTVTVTNANGCKSTSVTNVMVNTLPTPTAGCNTPVCKGKDIKLVAGDAYATNFMWSGPNGFFTQQQNPTITLAETTMAGLYTVTATDGLGCSGSAIISMIVNPLPEAVVASNNNKGCVPVCATFSVQSTSALQNISWKLNDESTIGSGSVASSCFKNAGNYTMRASFSDQNGCANKSGTFEVNVYPIPVADFNFTPTKPVVNNDIEFTDASTGAIIKEYAWHFTNQKNNLSLLANPHAIYENAGSYPIAMIVRSDKGCSDTIVKSIVVGEDFSIYVPNAFTPNGDGVNDTFQPKGFGIIKYELSVFNRWGERVFNTHDFGTGWDGTNQKKGKEVEELGVYVWKIQVTNVFGKSQELTGTVTLTK